ncbi:MAG: SMP-30/gluconolactonase/LRE family protein [Planctomycetaceae bacterium]|nr:SMP-30/gluconolactonase/LRE family protein [Planctomycetaceae bacterium]
MSPVLRTLILLSVPFLSGTLSAQDMPLSQVLIEDENWELVSEGHGFTEGPAVDADGQIYFSDVKRSKIYKVDTQGKVRLFVENAARTNGLMFGPDGLLYGCRMGDRQIVAYRKDGSHDVIASDVDSNDIAVAGNGDIYFSDPKGQRVWYIPKGGQPKIVAENVALNGLILWEHSGTLVTTAGPDAWLWTFRVEPDGSLTSQEKYYGPLRLTTSNRHPGGDGMTVDADGRLYVATRAGLQMFDPTGRMGGVIAKPQKAFLSNATFGGPDLSYLYVTSTDKVFRRKTKTHGISHFTK